MNGADLACEIGHVPGIFSWRNLSFLFGSETEGGRIGRIRFNPTYMKILRFGRRMNGGGSFSHEPFSSVLTNPAPFPKRIGARGDRQDLDAPQAVQKGRPARPQRAKRRIVLCPVG